MVTRLFASAVPLSVGVGSLVGSPSPTPVDLGGDAVQVRGTTSISSFRHLQIIDRPRLIAQILKARSIHLEGDGDGRGRMRNVLESRVDAEIIGAVGVKASGTAKPQIGVAGECRPLIV